MKQSRGMSEGAACAVAVARMGARRTGKHGVRHFRQLGGNTLHGLGRLFCKQETRAQKRRTEALCRGGRGLVKRETGDEARACTQGRHAPQHHPDALTLSNQSQTGSQAPVVAA